MSAASYRSAATAAILLALVAACGGIEGTGSPTQADIEGTGIVDVGTITDFGSIFVNGVEYATDTAEIVIDGAAARESDLQVGMVVTVTGEIFDSGLQGVARRVEFNSGSSGPAAARQLGIQDQPVQRDDATVTHDQSISTLPGTTMARARGMLHSADAALSAMVIAGAAVRTDPVSTEFIDRSGNSVTGLQFLGELMPGDRLEAVGIANNGVIEADHVRHLP